jgi:DNA-binding protein
VDKKASAIKENAPPPQSENTGKIIYIGNKNTKKFHLDTCRSLPAPKNQVRFNTRQEAINAKYVPCKICIHRRLLYLKGIIDRFEGNYAVVELEDRRMTNIEKSLLPENVAEGDCIILEDGKYIIDKNETENRKKRIQ